MTIDPDFTIDLMVNIVITAVGFGLMYLSGSANIFCWYPEFIAGVLGIAIFIAGCMNFLFMAAGIKI